MKAITIWQPWASLIAVGAKQYETRGWATNYRGPIAIHAAKRPLKQILRELLPMGDWDYHPDSKAKRDFLASVGNRLDIETLEYGVVVATARLAECWECIGPDIRGDLMIGHGNKTPHEWENSYLSDEELTFGNFENGRYAWELADVKKLDKPIPTRGGQGFWEWKGAE